MPIARSLFELQQIDNRMLQLQREKSQLDDGSALRAQRDTLEKAVSAAEETLNAHNARRLAAEEELSRREERLRTQEARLMNAKSAQEVASLQRDIEGITKSRGEFDEIILIAMDEAETVSAELEQLRAQLQETQTQLTAVEKTLSDETARIDEELLNAAHQRNSAAANLGEELLETYETAAAEHSGIAVCTIADGSCTVCGMAITPYNLREAKTADWPTCESCGRFLYVEAE